MPAAVTSHLELIFSDINIASELPLRRISAIVGDDQPRHGPASLAKTTGR